MAKIVSVAEAKKHLSDILGKVGYGGETFIIARRGKPVAKLVPVENKSEQRLANIKGWLDNDDEFFRVIERIVQNRHKPRLVKQ